MNPEFKRNLWLEISPSRLIMMPIALGLVAALCFVLDTVQPLETLFIVSCGMGAALILGWGSFAVVNSINSELAERTWDQQRLSALTPWEMAWGKLLGSAAYAWYGGLLCILVAFVVALMQPDPLTRCVGLFTGLLTTVALHAGLMASRLHTLDTQDGKNTSTLGRLFGVFMLLQSLPFLFLLVAKDTGDDVGRNTWWNLGLPFMAENFVLASLFLMLGLLAMWRSMGKQLMLRTTPWAWVLGIVAIGFIVAGYFLNFKIRAIPLITVSVTAIVTTYFAIFTEKNNLLVWRAVIFHYKNSTARRFFQSLPLWPVSFVLALIFATIYSAFGLGIDSDFTASIATSILWMSLLHCLRDCGIYIFLLFATRLVNRWV